MSVLRVMTPTLNFLNPKPLAVKELLSIESHCFTCLHFRSNYRFLMLFPNCAEPGAYSPELLTDTHTENVAREAEDEPGSFSPELVQENDNDEVVDPETDKADLVSPRFFKSFSYRDSICGQSREKSGTFGE